ncbi:11874_t:CDS:2 [Scutellospora calospora]|uniref:11874_t:CDS:1 n=1 Tax=Scutellospora calospora TaxID=85575 RepID=A0ACA9MQ30_9GLOM|nr:11874_t:CDS:2 [Scutellospora calospora]
MAARGGINSKGEVAPQPVKVQRYWPGKVPEGIQDYSSDEDEEQFEKEKEAEIITSIERVDITEKEAASDRRLRRLKEAKEAGHSEVIDRRRRHFKEEDQDVRDLQLRNIKIEQDSETNVEEEDDILALRRQRLRDRESESEETSEYETDSEEEQASRKLLKPVFIPKFTVRTKISYEFAVNEEIGVNEVDDTDGLDEQAEYEAWKLRELKRIKRDKEEREAEKEKEDIERRRNMSEEQRLAEDMERVKAQREKKSQGQYKFLQKYYHKGAFYLEPTEDIFKRDYTEATPDEAADQDTSRKDAAWSRNTGVNKSILSKLGGLHGGFDKPTSKKRRTE